MVNGVAGGVGAFAQNFSQSAFRSLQFNMLRQQQAQQAQLAQRRQNLQEFGTLAQIIRLPNPALRKILVSDFISQFGGDPKNARTKSLIDALGAADDAQIGAIAPLVSELGLQGISPKQLAQAGFGAKDLMSALIQKQTQTRQFEQQTQLQAQSQQAQTERLQTTIEAQGERLGQQLQTRREEALDDRELRRELQRNEIGFKRELAAFDAEKDLAIAQLKEGPKPTDIRGLRQEFTGLSEDFITVRDSFNRVQASAEDPSAAGDLALVFNYMKILDPGSVVRESEFATAQNAAGIPERIRNTFNRVLSGERLGENQRKDFVNRAERLFKAQTKSQKKLERQFRGIAKRAGFPIDQVVIDFLSAPADQGDGGDGGQAPVTEAPSVGEAREILRGLQ